MMLHINRYCFLLVFDICKITIFIIDKDTRSSLF